MLGNMFSQILGSLKGMAGGGGAQGANPFGDITSLIGGPGSESGTLFSLPNELLTGMVDLGTSENIIKDTMGLTKPIQNLVSGGLGGLGGLAGSGSSGSLPNPFGSFLPPHYLPLLALGAAFAAAEQGQEEE